MVRFAVRNHIVNFWKKCAFLSLPPLQKPMFYLFCMVCCSFFSWNWIYVCLNNLQILQSIQKSYWIGWQGLAPHWTCNVIQGWEWRIAWLFYCCLQLIFLRFVRNYLRNRALEQNSFLYLIRKLFNSLLQLMHIYSFVSRHSFLKVVYNIYRILKKASKYYSIFEYKINLWFLTHFYW